MATASTSRLPAIERCAGDPAAFVRDHWAKAPLLRRGAGPGGFDDLLSLEDVDRILATDNLKSPSLAGCLPQEIIDRVARLGLGYDHRRRVGTTMHLLGALREYGKMGVTCIGDTEDEARERYREVVAALT